MPTQQITGPTSQVPWPAVRLSGAGRWLALVATKSATAAARASPGAPVAYRAAPPPCCQTSAATRSCGGPPASACSAAGGRGSLRGRLQAAPSGCGGAAWLRRAVAIAVGQWAGSNWTDAQEQCACRTRCSIAAGNASSCASKVWTTVPQVYRILYRGAGGRSQTPCAPAAAAIFPLLPSLIDSPHPLMAANERDTSSILYEQQQDWTRDQKCAANRRYRLAKKVGAVARHAGGVPLSLSLGPLHL